MLINCLFWGMWLIDWLLFVCYGRKYYWRFYIGDLEFVGFEFVFNWELERDFGEGEWWVGLFFYFCYCVFFFFYGFWDCR